MNKNISIIGVPMDLGQVRKGVDLGPNAIRLTGLIERLQQLSLDVVDLGDIEMDKVKKIRFGFNRNNENLRNLAPIVNGNLKLASKINEVIIANRFPLILGGDHSIALGTIAGLSKHYNNLGVIWYDAHGDLNTTETTPSGNIHGMPLASSLGYGDKTLVELEGYHPKIKPENIVLIGTRSLDEGEKLLIKQLGIKVFTMSDIDHLGIKTVMEQTIKHLKNCDGVHLSLDLDGLDPHDAPGVGIPVMGGITYRESRFAMEILFNENIITSAEFVEVNPVLDTNNKTAKTAVDLICTLFGEQLL